MCPNCVLPFISICLSFYRVKLSNYLSFVLQTVNAFTIVFLFFITKRANYMKHCNMFELQLLSPNNYQWVSTDM